MTLLYPAFLWLILPLFLFLFKSDNRLVSKIHIVILILIVMSLSRPITELSVQKATVKARDVIIALDVSSSMFATDIAPSRYAFAKETIKTFLNYNDTDNIMLIAFTSNPLLLSPPTTDHQLIAVALESLNPEYILTKSTSLTTLFEQLRRLHVARKNLVLITDGGEENKDTSLIDLLQTLDISLITLAMGTPAGSTLKNKNNTLVKDKEGNLVISRVNPLLKRLSSAVQGSYINVAPTPAQTASLLDSAIASQNNTWSQVTKMRKSYQEWYQLPLLLASLLFLIIHTRAIKYLSLLVLFFGMALEASFFDAYHLNHAYSSYRQNDFNQSMKSIQKVRDASLQSQLLLGNLYYKTKHYQKALNTYLPLRSRSMQLRQQLFYNIANTYVHMGRYAKARIYYAKVLQLGLDKDARYNLARIALLPDKEEANLGMAHPKSQDASASKSQDQTKKNQVKEDQPSSGSGAGGESTMKKKKIFSQPKQAHTTRHPIGSKTYELINKGYMHETRPW